MIRETIKAMLAGAAAKAKAEIDADDSATNKLRVALGMLKKQAALEAQLMDFDGDNDASGERRAEIQRQLTALFEEQETKNVLVECGRIHSLIIDADPEADLSIESLTPEKLLQLVT